MKSAGKAFDVDTSPTKDVVVRGVTRDASVEACLHDLIDNSVDAIRADVQRRMPLPTSDIYRGYEISVTINGTELRIKDNAGGIPINLLRSEVLRFGKRSAHYNGIGTFGVGLNRAIFRLGQIAQIITDTGAERSSLILRTEDYLREADDWNVTAQQLPTSGDLGTMIDITRLPEDIAHLFADKDWVNERREQIGRIYSRFIAQGLTIEFGPKPARNLEIPIRENGPYEIEQRYYKTEDGVSIYIRCG